jgi:Fe-S-cluster containining protein
LENIKKGIKDGGCAGVCCSVQNPQLLYCEFLRTLNEIMSNWSAKDFVNLIERSLRTYLSDLPTKGCIFWNKNTKLCRCHQVRPLACYLYSIESDEEFIPKMARMKEIYKNNPLAIFIDQCRKCKTKDGTVVSKKESDELWSELVEIELCIGIEKEKINDGFDGTYRTFHDHLLIFLLPDYMLENLTKVRKFGTSEEKEQVISTFVNILSPVIRGLVNE